MRNMDEHDYQAAARSNVASLGQERARELIWLLELDDATRADAFRQFARAGWVRGVAGAFTDLELGPVMRGWLVEHLRLEIDAAG